VQAINTRGAKLDELTVRMATESRDAEAKLAATVAQAEAAEATKGMPANIATHGVSDALLAKASKVMYLRLDGGIVFQSTLHRNVWRSMREEFKPSG
jgi:hypothetical protein